MPEHIFYNILSIFCHCKGKTFHCKTRGIVEQKLILLFKKREQKKILIPDRAIFNYTSTLYTPLKNKIYVSQYRERFK